MKERIRVLSLLGGGSPAAEALAQLLHSGDPAAIV